MDGEKKKNHAETRKDHPKKLLKKYLSLELVPPFILGIFSIATIIILHSTQENWKVVNNALKSFIGIKFNFMGLGLVLFYILISYLILTFLITLKNQSFMHKFYNQLLIIFISSIIIFFLFLASFIEDINALSFIWYHFNGYHLMGYILGIFILVIVIIVLLLSIKTLITRTRPKIQNFRPRGLAFCIIISGSIVILVISILLMVYPSMFLYWSNLFLFFQRYINEYLYLLGLSLGLLLIWGVLLKLKKSDNLKERLFRSYQIYITLGIISCLVCFLILVVNMLISFSQKYKAFSFGNDGSLTFALFIFFSIPFSLLNYLTLKQSINWSRFNLKNQLLNKIRKKFTLHHKAYFIGGIVIVSSFLLIFLTPLLVSPPDVDLPFKVQTAEINGVNVPFRGNKAIPGFEEQPNTTEEGSRIFSSLGDSDWKIKKIGEEIDISFRVRNDETLAKLTRNNFYAVDYDDSKWRSTEVPSCFNVPEGTPDMTEYQGVVWYRRIFQLPNISSIPSDPTIYLKFLGSNYITDVWVDGRYVGYHEGGFNSFSFDITDSLKNDKNEHLIAIRVDSIGPNTDYDYRRVPPKGDFFVYGGIYRDIYLEICPNVHVVRADINPLNLETNNHKTGNIELEVDTTIKTVGRDSETEDNEYLLSLAFYALNFSDENELKDRASWKFANKSLKPPIIGETTTIIGEYDSLILGEKLPYNAKKFRISVQNINFWSTKSPSLYLLEINVTHNGITDVFTTQTGFRTFNVEEDDILLNQFPLFLAGNSYHEEYPGAGRALDDERRYQDLQLIQQNLSSNFLRTHYPLHPFNYLLADRLGLACWVENPVYWFNEIHFATAEVRNSYYAMFIEMIYRDFNRPSILFWSAANEPWSQDLLEIYLENLREMQEKLDPSRILAFASASPHLTDFGHRKLEMVTPNTYWGTFEGEFGEFSKGTEYAVETLTKNNPEKPILSMEFGLWRSAGEDVQVKCFLNTTSTLLGYDHIVGFTHWIAFDYHGNDYYNSMGAINIERNWSAPVADYMHDVYHKVTENNL